MRTWWPWVALLVIVCCYVVLLHHGLSIKTDSYVYWRAAQVGEPIYTQSSVKQVDGGILPYLYSPVVMAASWPLGLLPWPVAYWVCGLGALAGVICWGFLLGGVRGALVACLWPGSVFCVMGGNVEPWLWVLSLTRAGVLVAGLFKPVWWILGVFDRRPWTRRDLLVGAVVAGCFVGGLAWWGGWSCALASITALTGKTFNLSLANLWLLGLHIPVTSVTAAAWLLIFAAWRRGRLSDRDALTLAWLTQPLLRLYYFPYLMRWFYGEQRLVCSGGHCTVRCVA